jgi:hypothetical protein
MCPVSQNTHQDSLPITLHRLSELAPLSLFPISLHRLSELPPHSLF